MPEQQDIELCSNFSFLSTDANMTPPSSDTTVEDVRNNERNPTETHKWENPWPGNTYIIREPKSKLQVTLVGGQIRMKPHLGDQGGYHWECVYDNGWLGFRNPSAFVYLGFKEGEGIVAEVKWHKWNEFFITRGYPGGGHVLFTKHDHDLHMVNIEGDRLHESRDHYTVWEFIKV
ncbi:hypothetical protein F5B19DRAFT_121800 [Rostrohypoxylon terebratum]|nr:hypothetical protein F5B19DRAFT_121800 [Rostrohypoxylon terebratum]